MALYDRLPVYKACYDLLLDVYRLSGQMSKDHRYTLGENAKKTCTEIIILIYRANTNVKKYAYLKQAKEKVEVIRLLMRIYKDLNQIGVERFVAVSEQIENIRKQINAWAKLYEHEEERK